MHVPFLCLNRHNPMELCNLHTGTDLKHFVGNVDEQLFQRVVLEDFETKNIQKP